MVRCISTVLQHLYIPVTLRTAEGSLNVVPDKLVLKKCFPVSFVHCLPLFLMCWLSQFKCVFIMLCCKWNGRNIKQCFIIHVLSADTVMSDWMFVLCVFFSFSWLALTISNPIVYAVTDWYGLSRFVHNFWSVQRFVGHAWIDCVSCRWVFCWMYLFEGSIVNVSAPCSQLLYTSSWSTQR